MRIRSRKLLSVLLTVAMVCGLFAGLPLTASAADLGITIDYENETLTGLAAGTNYSLYSDAIGTVVASFSTGAGVTTYEIDSGWMSAVFYIGVDGETVPSNWQELVIPARPVVPVGVASTDETGVGENDGTITGLADTMEYTLDPDAAWTAVGTGSTTVEGLAPGTYYVRYKFTSAAFASESATVTIAAAHGTDLTDAFTDPNFLNAVYGEIGKTSPMRIYAEDLEGITSLDVCQGSITSIAGIQHFVDLKVLLCSDNNITALPSNLPSSLVEIRCGGNLLTTLPATLPVSLEVLHVPYNNISTIPALPSSLKKLRCEGNQLTSLNVSGLTALEYLDCSENKLTSLNASNCTALNILYCQRNQLATFNVTGCTALEEIYCSRNQIASVPALPASLKEIHISNNLLTSLNNLPSGLEYLHCHSNLLTSVSALPSGLNGLVIYNNNLTSLDVSGLTNLGYLDCSYNKMSAESDVTGTGTISAFTAWESGAFSFAPQKTPGLYNAGDIAVINAIIANNGLDWTKAPSDGSYIPSDWDWRVEWSSGDNDGKNKRVIELNLGDENLTGALNVSGLTELEYLDCGWNQLTSLNVSGLTALETIYCEANQFTTLNFSGCTSLVELHCSRNLLTKMPALPASLKQLHISNNRLTSLSGLPSGLEYLYCHSNLLATLPASLPSGLIDLVIRNNQLAGSLDVSGLTGLTWLDCGSNQITSLVLPRGLQSLECYQNRLTGFDVTGLNYLYYIDCAYNYLDETNPGNDIIGFNSISTNLNGLPQHDPSFVAATKVINLPTTMSAGTTITLTGTVFPSDATNKTIIWETGWDNCGATLNSNKLTAQQPGEIWLYAVIENGAAAGEYLWCYFRVVVTASSGDVVSYGGGGSTATIPAADGAVTVEYSQSGGSVTLTLPDSKITEIIGKSDDTAVLDLSGIKDATTATLPKAALTAFADAGLDVEIILPQGTVTLSGEAAVSVAAQAGGSDVSLELKQVSASALTSAQREALKDGDTVIDISILSGEQKISTFDGELTVTIPYTGALPVAVWYLNDAGELEKLDCTYNAETKTVSFTLDHLSLYVVGQDTAWANPFTDVKTSDWFYESVEYAVTNGLFNGTSDTTFSPNSTMTRGMMVTVMWRMAGSPAVSEQRSSGTFYTDVPDGEWYSAAIAWAAENGIVTGVGDRLFAPNDNITREQMAVMLMRYMESAKVEYVVTEEYRLFADEDAISDYAKNAVQVLNKLGIINGKGNNVIDPKAGATRAEVATMFMNFLKEVGAAVS